jgi:hypothetical protein
LKAQKQTEFAEFEKSLAQNDDQVKKGDADTQQALQAIKVSWIDQQLYDKNKASVIDKMVKIVGECKPEPHPNVLPPKA